MGCAGCVVVCGARVVSGCACRVARLWSIYKFDGRDLKQRLCETIPAVIAALAMLVLVFLALVAKNDELQPYVWATFTRRRRS